MSMSLQQDKPNTPPTLIKKEGTKSNSKSKRKDKKATKEEEKMVYRTKGSAPTA